MALPPEEIDARLGEVARLASTLLPAGWKSATLSYEALGSFEAGALRYGHSGRGKEALPRSGVFALLRDLRRDCYRSGLGTWFGYRIALRAGDLWGAEEQQEKHFSWRDAVTVADCGLELATYPRPDWRIPRWMRPLVEAHRAAGTFDPGQLLARPLPESALLGPGNEDYFPGARQALRHLMAGGLERLRIGRLEEGHWSVVPAGSAWLAVRFADGRCDPLVAFPDVRSALAHAAGRVMSEDGREINSALLAAADVLSRRRERELDAWNWGKAGSTAVRLSVGRRRASSSADDAHISLGPYRNRPGGYFVCPVGPVPETGPYISAREVCELAAFRRLREPVRPAEQRAAEPPPVPARNVLPPGTVVDAYGDNDPRFLYTLGTPDYVRGAFSRSHEHSYHVYRVERALLCSPGGFAPHPVHSDEEAAELARTDPGEGYYVGHGIAELIAAGHLAEITGTDGAPARPPDPVITVRKRVNLLSLDGSGSLVVRQGPRPDDEERRAALVGRMRRILTDGSPAGWRRMDLRITMTVPVADLALTVIGDDGGHVAMEPDPSLADIAGELRSMMYRPGEGTWFGLRLTIDTVDGHWIGYNDEFVPSWGQPLPAEAWGHDLSVFPRSADRIPPWLLAWIESDN